MDYVVENGAGVWAPRVRDALAVLRHIPVSRLLAAYLPPEDGKWILAPDSEEKTVIGGWTSGPIYRKGTPHITGWASVWSDRERKERVFLVVPKDSERKVHEIHQALASGFSGASK